MVGLEAIGLRAETEHVAEQLAQHVLIVGHAEARLLHLVRVRVKVRVRVRRRVKASRS